MTMIHKLTFSYPLKISLSRKNSEEGNDLNPTGLS